MPVTNPKNAAAPPPNQGKLTKPDTTANIIPAAIAPNISLGRLAQRSFGKSGLHVEKGLIEITTIYDTKPGPVSSVVHTRKIVMPVQTQNCTKYKAIDL